MVYFDRIDENPLFAANTDAQANTIYGIWSDKMGNVFAAAESGVIFHHTINDGKTRAIDVGDSTVDFYDIFGFANECVIAVGTRGIIYRYDFNDKPWYQWIPPGYTGKNWLESVWGRNPNDVCFVGDEGIIWHYDGKTARSIKISGSYKNRLYSVTGLGDGEKFIAAGSYGTLVEFKREADHLTIDKLYAGVAGAQLTAYKYNRKGIIEEKATKVYTGISNDFYGIERIPGKQEFLICGKDGAIFLLAGGRIQTITEMSFQPMLTKIFGIDILRKENKFEIVMVGWDGYSLHFDGEKWAEYELGPNSFMEGIVYAGKNAENKDVWVAGGFHGRIMTYNSSDKKWRINQSGRCEFINCTAMSSKGFVGGADTGRVIAGADYRSKEIYSSGLPHNYNVAIPTGNPEEFLLAGESAKLEIVNSVTGVIRPCALPQSWPYTSEDILCMTKTTEGTYYLAGKKLNNQGSIFFNYNPAVEAGIVALNNIKQAGYLKNIYAISYCDDIGGDISKRKFYVLNYDGEIELLDPYKKITKKLKLERKPDILFGDYGKTFISCDTSLYKMNNETAELYIEDFNKFFVKGEYAKYATLANAEAEIHIGGSKGSILIIAPDKTISAYHSRGYNAIHSVSIQGDKFVAGLRRGRVVTGSLNGKERYFSGISAPTYSVVCKHTAGFCYAGESGVIGIFSDVSRTTTWRTYNLLGDVLCADAYAGSAVLAGCGFICVVPHDINFSRQIEYFTFDLEHYRIITSIIIDKDQCYFGTSQGEIYSFPIKLLLDGTLSEEHILKISESLGQVIINIDIKLNKPGIIEVTLENGSVTDVPADPASVMQQTMRYNFDLQLFTRPSTCNRHPEDGFWLAGSESFLAHIRGTQISIYTVPWTIYTISLHGGLREEEGYSANEYWVAGSSGTLFVYTKAKWYKIESGTGNHLYAGAASKKLLLITGEYGALRWQAREYIDDHIPSTNTLPSWHVTQHDALAHEGMAPVEQQELIDTEVNATLLLKDRGFTPV